MDRLRFSIHALAAAALAAFTALAAPAAAAGGWHYELGTQRDGQQGNFCRSSADALEIVHIFEKFSPRTGYTALANAPGCFTGVRSFTPLRVVHELVIAEGKDSEYRMRFVEVTSTDGETLFLVTTREVRMAR